jgi:hypothetical protein
MRLLHPTTRNAARDAWGRRHAGLIVGGPFYLAAIAIGFGVWVWVQITSSDQPASSVAKAGRPVAKPVATAAGNAGDQGLPVLAIGLAGLVTLAIAAALVMAKTRRSNRHLEVDVDRLERRGASWSPEAEDDPDEEDGWTVPLDLRHVPNDDDAGD